MADKKTWKIGEVAQLLDVRTSVLRFWETEFPQIEPLRTEKGQRLYTEEHIGVVRKIHSLLYGQGMTIEGAKRVLGEDRHGKNCLDNAFLRMVAAELEDISRLLKRVDKK